MTVVANPQAWLTAASCRQVPATAADLRAYILIGNQHPDLFIYNSKCANMQAIAKKLKLLY